VSPEGSTPSGEPERSGEATQSGETLRSQDLLGEIVRYAADKKAGEVVELDLRDVLGYTDWFLICSGNTERQTKAIHDGILEGCKREHGTLPRRVEGFGKGDWILMDYLDVVVHIFTPATREYYRLEQLWGEVPARAAGGGA
jgi:ribosome-associated protein